MQFQTHYNRTPTPAEINSGEILVERAGYISAQQRIENMMLAGQRLVQFRKEQFDFPDKIDEDFSDPTREPNFDLADASMLSMTADMRLKASQTALEAQNEAIEASLKDLDTSSENPPK